MLARITRWVSSEMPAIRRFEDVIAWQKARVLTQEIYRITRTGPFALDYGLARQIRGAAVSVMANVAEGFERSGRRELSQFIAISKSSCGEVLSHLYVALDAGYLSVADFDQLKAQTKEVARILGGLRVALLAKRK
jgi:four helix bundle protein